MGFDPAIDIRPTSSPLGFIYGPGVFGPSPELRPLDAIRWSLFDPECHGPDPVYAIAMDVGKEKHRSLLQKHKLLFGVVTYADGRLGREPVRSQGHLHKKTRNNKMAPPEVYEIWSGKAIVYMQERVDADPGRCFAVEAGPGEVVVVPPDWAHTTVSIDPDEPLTFGALCDRDYGFEYDILRAHGGPAWFPVFGEKGGIDWIHNKRYLGGELVKKRPEKYPVLGIADGLPVYAIFERNPDIFGYMANPELKLDAWKRFVP